MAVYVAMTGQRRLQVAAFKAKGRGYMSTTQTESNAVAVIDNVTLFNGAITRTNSDGKVLGQRLSFIQEYAAGDVRKALKVTGLKGKALTDKVNEVLSGSLDMAWALHDAQMSVARSVGFVPVTMDGNKKGNALTIRMAKPAAKAPKAPITKEEAMKALGLTEEDIALLKAVQAKPESK